MSAQALVRPCSGACTNEDAPEDVSSEHAQQGPKTLGSYWFDRFSVLESPDGNYVCRDLLRGHRKQIDANQLRGLSEGAKARFLFENGFLPGSLSLECPASMRRHESAGAAVLSWQFPCRTEELAWESHRALSNPGRAAGALHMYLGAPWATWIDLARRSRFGPAHRSLLQYGLGLLETQLSGIRLCMEQLGVSLRVHTVCQHVYWRDLQSEWRRLGIDDVWLSHLPAGGLADEGNLGFTVHPWALHAVNVEESDRCAGLVIGKDPAAKRLLASFVGAHADHYLSDIRTRLAAFRGMPGFHIELTGAKWHFEDVVYRHQIAGEALEYRIGDDVAQYNRVLSDSVFSLCPAGAGPNTLRLWESLAVGAVPVLLGHFPRMPEGGTLPPIDWNAIVVRVADDELGELSARLRAMPLDEVRRRQRLAIETYALVRRQRCFD